MKKKITYKMIGLWRIMGTLDRYRANSATSKGHKHIHHEAAWASIGDITPAEYRRAQIKNPLRAKEKRLSARHKFLQNQSLQSEKKLNKIRRNK